MTNGQIAGGVSEVPGWKKAQDEGRPITQDELDQDALARAKILWEGLGIIKEAGLAAEAASIMFDAMHVILDEAIEVNGIRHATPRLMVRLGEQQRRVFDLLDSIRQMPESELGS